MDRSFQNASFSLSQTQSPSFLTQNSLNRGSKRPIPPHSFRKSSRWSVSAKSNQSVQVVLKTQHNFVERFGQPLPVLITEALTFADRNTVVSAGISEHGYAWVVCGRRLLIWQYRQNLPTNTGTPQRKHGGSNLCFELQLPQSDLSHRAELVTVFLSGASHSPSCIAVSPEGLIRYWPAVSHEDVSIEQTIDLQGQECDSLTDVEGLGCILATTTCSIVLVQPQSIGGRHILNCQSLKTPTGWLGGISKRMSSLIFGPITSEQSAETRLVRVHCISYNDDSWAVFILAGHSLQKWRLSTHEPEQLIYVAEFNRLVRDNFHAAIWENCVGDAEIETWILDIQHDKNNLILLAAAVNIPVSPQMHYALISVPMNSPHPPVIANEFKLLKMAGLYREDNPEDTLSYRFLWCSNAAYLFNQKTIAVIKAPDEPDILEFSTPQDLILGGSICVNTPIFFSKNDGLVSVTCNDSASDLNLSMTGPNTSLDQSSSEAVNNLSVYHLDPMEIYTAYTDTLGQVKAAFIFHVKNQMSSCLEIINELFPAEAEGSLNVDGILDKIVVSMCTDLINDLPACDPRWSNEVNPGIGSSYSMQILNQLEDKLKALNIFFRFLRETNLWNRLAAYTIRGTPNPTVLVLEELSEKVVAAIHLKAFPSNQILDKAIDRAVLTFDLEVDTEFGLTNQDIFYSKVSFVHKGLQELVEGCSEIVNSDMNPSEISSVINQSNEMILAVMNEVLQYRKTNSDIFVPTEAAVSLAPDYLPWTSANGSEGLLDCLWEQHNFTCNYGMKFTSNKQLKNVLCRQLVSLTDIILDGRKSHIQSLKGSQRGDLHYKQFCIDRRKLIQPFIDEKQWESAIQLAEKFLDFESLILVCEATDNQNRLDEYMSRFNNEGFSEYVYNWYLKENKQAKLIDKCRKFNNKNTQKLTGFLSQHPSLLWMQQIFDKNFGQAATTLYYLSENEKDSVTKQKTMYSFAKLAKLAALNAPDTENFVDRINSKLELISYQEEIPDYVLQHFGYNTTNPSVISPKELIHLYICPEYTDASEMEFKKALDVLNHIEDLDLKEELCLKIWREALLRETWQFNNLDAPLEILQNSLFFKIADVAISVGSEPDKLLPPIDVLLEHSSIENLRNNKAFIYLLKTGYEHVQRMTCSD